MVARSLLFLPATRPELVGKLCRFAPDAAVIDLEDAVPAGEKAAARGGLAGALRSAPVPLFVRINPIGTPWWRDDVRLAEHDAVCGLVVPKLERAEDLDLLARALGPRRVPVVAGIETVLGVLDVRALLRPPVVAAYFGAEDLVAQTGGERTAAGLEVLYARSRVALAAHAAGVHAIDQAVLALDDEAAFLADARAGARLGYGGKLCIHPRQVAWAHAAFTPARATVERSRRLIAAYDAAGGGACTFEGAMVDEPIVRRARDVLARAGEDG